MSDPLHVPPPCRSPFHHCTAEFLKYKYMNAFDRAMQHLDKAFGFVSAPHSWVSRKDEADKIIVVERGEPTNQPACFAAATK